MRLRRIALLSAATGLAMGSAGMPRAWAGSATAQVQPPRYRLGPGDRLMVKLFQLESFDSSVSVLPDGSVNLPRVGSLQLWGLSLEEARQSITKAYSTILRRPVVYLDLVGTRPLRVSVTGEVQRPGLYTLGLQETNQLGNGSGSGQTTSVASQGWPTLVEAIQKAGGITARGDLRRVTLVRPIGGSGRNESLQVNYWEALRSGIPMRNPLIYDGDSIRVPAAQQQTESELLTVASSSFAPTSITVNVVGEVVRPGPQQVRANSPLSQAVLAAGGVSKRGSRNTVELLRLEPNGTIVRQQLTYQPAAALGDPSNPPLRDGDVVVVDRHLWAKATDGVKAALDPIGPVLSGATLFRVLYGFF